MIDFIADKRDTFRSQNSGNSLFEKLFDEGIQDSFVQLDAEMRNMKAQYRQYKRELNEAGNNAEAIQEIKKRFSHVSIFDEIED
jgi:succinate dehydrogenase/fumarate reductase flavoprotein subunit